MTDSESLARADVGLMKEVVEVNALIRACVPCLRAAHQRCVQMCKDQAGLAAVNSDAAYADTADEADYAAAQYRFLVGFIEELTERYA